jgi:plastocyanin
MKNSVIFKSRYLIGIAIIAAILIIPNSCSKSAMNNMYGTGSNGTKGGPGTNEVWIQGMAFDPATITVYEGTTITWTNKDAVAHTVTSDGGQFNSGNIGNNGTYSYLFSTAGSYPYHCSIHKSMTATVVVKAVTTSSPGY